MKALLLFIPVLLLATDYSDIEAKISELKSARHTPSASRIRSLKDPFNDAPKPKKYGNIEVAPEPLPKLEAIFDLQALLDEKWCKEGDKVGSWTVVKIDEKHVQMSSPRQSEWIYLFKKQQ